MITVITSCAVLNLYLTYNYVKKRDQKRTWLVSLAGCRGPTCSLVAGLTNLAVSVLARALFDFDIIIIIVGLCCLVCLSPNELQCRASA